MPLGPVMVVKYLIALSIVSSGTSMPAFRAPKRPIMMAPLTDVSWSVASGEYRQAPSGFFLAEVTASFTANSSDSPKEIPLPLPPSSVQSVRSSTTP